MTKDNRKARIISLLDSFPESKSVVLVRLCLCGMNLSFARTIELFSESISIANFVEGMTKDEPRPDIHNSVPSPHLGEN